MIPPRLGFSLVIAVAASLAACGDTSPTGASATPSPSPLPSVPALAGDVGGLLPPPGPASTPVPGSPGQVVSQAAGRTLGAGSMRINLTLQVTATAGSYTLSGKGEMERPGRAHMDLSVSAIGRTFEAESVLYDGTLYKRSNQGPWQAGGRPGTANQPDAFFRYIGSATNIQDAGPASHGGHDTERYTALLPAQEAGGLPPGLTVWVDRASGFVDGEEVVASAAGGGRTLDATIDFLDVGVPLTVTRPTP